MQKPHTGAEQRNYMPLERTARALSWTRATAQPATAAPTTTARTVRARIRRLALSDRTRTTTSGWCSRRSSCCGRATRSRSPRLLRQRMHLRAIHHTARRQQRILVVQRH
eukprot:COSAG06_NODE_24196_length_669_cov_56.907018_1_plen_109_part_01